jgi:hypothetical protein
MRPVLGRIKQLIYGVFGNHDTIRMVPDLEAMRIRMLLNECEPIMHGGATIYLAGIDNANYFRVETSKRPHLPFPMRHFRSCYRTHQKSIDRQPMPVSICC